MKAFDKNVAVAIVVLPLRRWAVRFPRLCIFLVVAIVVFATTLRQSYAADLGTCEKDPKGQHLFFDIAQGKKLLGALAELKTSREQNRLLEERIKIKEEVVGLWRLQAQAAEKALGATVKALANEKTRAEALSLSVTKWQQEAARTKAERVWWAVGGLLGGAVIIGGAILVGWVVAGR